MQERGDFCDFLCSIHSRVAAFGGTQVLKVFHKEVDQIDGGHATISFLAPSSPWYLGLP